MIYRIRRATKETCQVARLFTSRNLLVVNRASEHRVEGGGDGLMSEQYHGDMVILMESSDVGAKPGIRKARTNDFNEIQRSQIPLKAMTRLLLSDAVTRSPRDTVFPSYGY